MLALALVTVLAAAGCAAESTTHQETKGRDVLATPSRLSHVDVVVFAPHPDDEVIVAGGVIQQAVSAGKKVRVVFATNGDGYPQAAAALLGKPVPMLAAADYAALAKARQQEAIDADRALGLDASQLVFLGYPDGALASLYADTGRIPVRSPPTGRSQTYGPERPDYHTLAHGRSAPYNRAAALTDFAEVLRDSSPSQVYVTDRADTHLDHSATYNFVHDVAAATRFHGTLATFVVHSGSSTQWPWPLGQTPGSAFEQHTDGGRAYPMDVPWPPPIRVPLTADQVAAKLRALSFHRSQWELPGDRQYLESFVKSEEIFWTTSQSGG